MKKIESMKLKERLIKLPEMTMAVESKLLALNNKINSLKTSMDLKKISFMSQIKKEIVTEKVGEEIKEKPKFRNDLARDIELNNRLSVNIEYQSWKKELEEKIQVKAETEIEYSYLKRTFGAAKAIAVMGTITSLSY